MAAPDSADVWVLMGPHRGDNNQVLALAEGLGMPFRTIDLQYTRFAHLPALLRSASISGLRPESRNEIAGPWPRLVIGIGQRSGPVSRYIKERSGGRTKNVRLGDPMVSPSLFDLVITSTQYAVRDAPNVVRLPITITSAEPQRPDRFEERWLEAFPHPRRLLVIGGKTSLWRFDPELIRESISVLKGRTEREGGSTIAVTSPRTSPELIAAAQSALGMKAVVTGPFPAYGALLSGADEIHVTGDSVSMLSDAIAAGKPVGLIPLEPDYVARLVRNLGAIRGRPFRLRDLKIFWDDLRARKLVGTIWQPLSGTLDVAPIDTAIAAIRDVLEGRLPASAESPISLSRTASPAVQPAA